MKMKRKIRITLSLDSEVLKRLDKLCEDKNLSRPQVIEMIFSTDGVTVDYMTDQIKRLGLGIGF
ncbi:ribbon-helix-helix protein, CopG family [Desulfosporosinus sp. OT]|uniref:ribbon-helix-helix protein, CopG family n=1 Tax=Desulfosporosinus sp. OT TaxID=913865 RepID=UPI000223AF0B|nr:ribbon-helix-helix protein, CopG family [Desulfosporosinus sp. OT]EGW39637.1 ribbon-helix-helix, copG family protein [Desulfosporosinus sp. OT]